MKKVSAVVILIVGFAIGAIAQSAGLWTGTPYNFPIASSITSSTGAGCTPPAAGMTNYCRTGVGEQISCNGAAYIPGTTCTPTVAGVTSWNGQTGAVTYTPPAPPVTSVNGKTGAVTISASATAPQVTLN